MKIKDGFRLHYVMGSPTVIGETVDLIDFNKIISFNESAAYLWGAVEGREFSLDDLVDLLVSRYQIDESVARPDATEIVENWINVGLVQP